ncbi:hypothetical protein BS50DRAFT_404727 [Corynespora cassiicola Philippines]|uniref:Uncharacterized protein n=1 Tax=Corynespora cassiicola Philippines TaxID=1448308 RepID=A0A2T2NKT7_CORCC|nr:hypothetical protein BS50DRAFT_404727 [Corynespora cassiicola Philippines]
MSRAAGCGHGVTESARPGDLEMSICRPSFAASGGTLLRSPFTLPLVSKKKMSGGVAAWLEAHGSWPKAQGGAPAQRWRTATRRHGDEALSRAPFALVDPANCLGRHRVTRVHLARDPSQIAMGAPSVPQSVFCPCMTAKGALAWPVRSEDAVSCDTGEPLPVNASARGRGHPQAGGEAAAIGGHGLISCHPAAIVAGGRGCWTKSRDVAVEKGCCCSLPRWCFDR